MSGRRTHARQIAVQALYQHDVQARSDEPITAVEDLRPFIHEAVDTPQVREHAFALLSGTVAQLDEIDERLRTATSNWRLERVAIVDRCILRLAIHEFLAADDVPPKVVMNEAIELAKKFSTEQSGGFVNGVLDRVWRDLVAESGDTTEPTTPSKS